jgi:hypothetical protein
LDADALQVGTESFSGEVEVGTECFFTTSGVLSVDSVDKQTWKFTQKKLEISQEEWEISSRILDMSSRKAGEPIQIMI